LIGAKSKTNIEIRFNPLKRLSPFKEDLNLSVIGSKRKLLTITGSCQGIEVALESDAVPFGSICEGCRISKKLQMENSGDLGTKFKWDNSSFGPDFSISPAEGFLAPHSGVVFEVMFHPTRVFDDFRRDRLMCMVDGAPPLFLTLSGSCEKQPSDNIKEIEFSARVREVDTQKVTINNPTNAAWVVKPAITNSFWSGDTHLRIPAKSSGDYEIAYKPLTMTLPQSKIEVNDAGEEVEGEPETKRHEGSVFFPLPDGTALLYNLFGTSDEPVEEDNFEKTAAAKEKMVFEFPVKNWLKKAQRFRVNWDDENDRFRGAQSLDVPANGLRTYKLSFFGLKQGESYESKVTFTNPESGEYIFYNIKANVTEPIVMGEIKLHAPVRQTMQHVLSIENPLSIDKNVTFDDSNWWNCDDACIRVRRLGEMTGNPECNFEIEFRPLVVISEPKTVRLTIQSVELGEYHYDLILTSEAAASERALQFKASLGSSHIQTFRFKNMVQSPTEYKCICGNPDAFEMEGKIMAPAAEDWEGTDVEFTISFEPIALGEVRDTLRIVSDVGGEFTCSLYGNGVAPRPQGPFMIAAGGSTSIEFKNVFNDAREFSFVVDNPLFSVNVGSQKLDANKVVTLTVKFDGPGDESKADETISGKLYVSCPELKELPPWIYYLSSKNA
jgi:hydrocephalus-inducing protein